MGQEPRNLRCARRHVNWSGAVPEIIEATVGYG